jgi:serine/threonine protein kinase/lipopolysaccharide biosynthesis regulator YciM
MSVKCPKCQHENPEDTLFCGKCGTQFPDQEKIVVTETMETPKEELTRGTTFAGRYEIIEELGKGGMGRVYRVEDTKLEQEVALKLIKPEIAKDKKTIERFRNELKTARMIAHKNVCRMFDLGEASGAHFITMEYIRGEDLKSMIRMSGQLGMGTAISIAKQVGEGLIEAHRLGVVHRDLKPQNIMIDKEGNARIMDFGIARSLRAKGITGSGVMIGTPEYMSPEQIDGKEADQRADIYSLGVILYEMVTGRVPFEGDTPFSIGVKQKSEVPKPPKEINEQIPEELNRVILKCMEKDKESRYQSVGELHSELINLEQGIPTTEKIIPEKKPLTSREVTVTFGVKKLFIPALILGVIIIAAIAIWQLLPKKDVIPLTPTDKPLIAIMYFDNNTGDEGLDNWRKALPDLLITDLSQSKYLSVLTGDRIYSILQQLNLLEAKSFSTEDLENVISKGKATHILHGNYTKAGETLRINTMLHEAGTGKLIASDSVDCVGEEGIYGMVDELTKHIKKNLELTPQEIAQDVDKEIGEITTSSPDAYKYYSEGRKHHMNGDAEQSIPFMERAVTIDPDFAMAYRSLAASYGNLGNFPERNKYTQKAFDLRDKVSQRERLLIEAQYNRNIRQNYHEAVKAFEEYLDTYPEDIIWNLSLGVLYESGGEWEKSLNCYKRSWEQGDKSFLAMGNLAGSYMLNGIYDKAREIGKEYLDTVAEAPWVYYYQAVCSIIEGKYDQGYAEVEKAVALNPRIFANGVAYKAIVTYLQDDFDTAEKESEILLEMQLNAQGYLEVIYRTQGQFSKAKEQAQLGLEFSQQNNDVSAEVEYHETLAHLFWMTDNPKQALDEIEKARKIWSDAYNIDRQQEATFFKGLINAGTGSLAAAQTIADELKREIENSIYLKNLCFYYHLLGRIDAEKKNYSQAIEHFEKAYSLLPAPSRDDFMEWHAFFVFPLGLAYYESGNLAKAKEEFERITEMTTGRLFFGELYAKALYMLGKICEEQGDKAKAIEHYQKFLSLWKDADPGIAEVDDAQKRLGELKGN